MLVKTLWNKAAPYSHVTLHCVINVGYSMRKGEPQQDVYCEQVHRRAALKE